MTQPPCNEYQYQDNKGSSIPADTNNNTNSSNPQQQQQQQQPYEQNPQDEATEMLIKILGMSNNNEASATGKLLNTEDNNSDSDVSYWSEDERTILRAFYENERENEEDDQNDQNDELLLEKYIMNLCQTAAATQSSSSSSSSLSLASSPHSH